MSSPCVSILVTTYNGARFIAETIDCVLAQSFTDFELLVVDDGSTDTTLDILAGCRDPRLRVVRTPRNLGVVGARNFGFVQLRGRYVATLDHDDLWRPTRLEAGIVLLEANPNLDFVGTRVMVMFPDRLEVGDRPGNPTPMLLRWMVLLDCPLVYSSLLFRRLAARRPDGGFVRPDVRYADDYELVLRLALVGDGARIDQPLTVYRVHGANTTESVRHEMRQHAVTILTEVYARWLGEGAAAAAERIVWHIARHYPASSLAELNEVGDDMERLLASFLATWSPAEADRRRIVDYARAAYWRAVRTNVRDGRVWLIGCYRRHSSLSMLGRVPVDVGVSLLVGLARLVLRQVNRRVTGGAGAPKV